MRFLKVSALVTVTLFFAVALLGLLSVRGLPARGAGSTIGGDVNCDGKVDISDAVFTLQFLFTGGPPPCALAQEQEVLDKLNALGEQVTALQQTISSRLPSLQNIVAIQTEVTFPKDGGAKPFYEVPNDKWFILTSLGVEPVNGSLTRFLDGKSTSIPEGRLGNQSLWRTWTSGVVFPPGSQLLISFPSGYHNEPFTSPFIIQGYFIDT